MNPMPITREDVERVFDNLSRDIRSGNYVTAHTEFLRVQAMLMVEMRDLLLEIYQRLPRENL